MLNLLIISRRNTILSWDHKIVYEIINHQPEGKDPESNNKTAKNINETVHAKINSSFKRDQTFFTVLLCNRPMIEICLKYESNRRPTQTNEGHEQASESNLKKGNKGALHLSESRHSAKGSWQKYIHRRKTHYHKTHLNLPPQCVGIKAHEKN